VKVKSVGIPEDIDRAIEYVARSEKIEKNSSLRKLVRLGLEVYVAKSYASGKVTLREAGDLLNLARMETLDLLRGVGINGNIRAKDVMDALKARSRRSRT
jgi:predicted HTH domain antitoxin